MVPETQSLAIVGPRRSSPRPAYVRSPTIPSCRKAGGAEGGGCDDDRASGQQLAFGGTSIGVWLKSDIGEE